MRKLPASPSCCRCQLRHHDASRVSQGSGCCAGDRYLLKLFHDWLFHPTGPSTGAPVLDWGRVVESLNKLDAGVGEEVSLLSRDEASLLVRCACSARCTRRNALQAVQTPVVLEQICLVSQADSLLVLCAGSTCPRPPCTQAAAQDVCWPRCLPSARHDLTAQGCS